MFNLFKKKEKSSYDVTRLTLEDLDVGFIFDYNLKSWLVKEKYEYDWGNHNISNEFKASSGDEEAYLSVEKDSELTVCLTNPIKMRQIESNIVSEIMKTGKVPDVICFEDTSYYFDSESPGYFRDCQKETEAWEELLTWDFYTKDEQKVLNITQWDERNFEAHAGIVLESHHFTNILPALK